MITLQTHKHARITTLCALYFAQGVPWGFVAITLRAFFTEAKMDPVTLGGFLAVAHAPWAFKPLWAPVIDSLRFAPMGQRRPWILLAQGLMTLTVALMLTIGDLVGSVVALGWLVAIHNTFSALQDVATDALAVDLLQDDERGKANGLMYGAKILGGAVGGTGMSMIAASFGMPAALLFLTAVMCLAVLFPVLLVERPGERRFPWSRGQQQAAADDTPTPRLAPLLFGIVRAFSMRSTVIGAVTAVAAYLGSGFLSVVGALLYIQKLGWDKTEHADMSTFALVVGVGGSIFGGWMSDRIGAKRVIVLSAACLGASWVIFGLTESLWAHFWYAGALMIIEAVFLYALTAGFLALFMQISWPLVAATQFTIYMALLNLGTTLGTAVGGRLVDAEIPYTTLFLTAGLLQFVVVALVPLIDPAQTTRELGPNEV